MPVLIKAWLACLLVFPLAGLAANSVIGNSDTALCYEASLMPINEQGVEACSDALRSKTLTRREQAATLSNRGIIYARNGRFERAFKDHDEAIRLQPDSIRAHINRGTAYYLAREYPLALEKSFDKAIQLNGGPLSIVWLNRGLTLLKLKRLQDARLAFETVLQYNPHDRSAKRNLEELTAYMDSQP